MLKTGLTEEVLVMVDAFDFTRTVFP